MKKIFTTSLTLFSLFVFSAGQASAQCTPLSSSYWGEMLPNAGCGTFANYALFGPGQYFQMPVLAGGSYTISTCGNSINTQITGFNATDNNTPIFYNDDNGPDCGGLQASVTYVSAFSDYLRVNVSEYNCLPGGTSSITVKVRQNNNLSITSSGADMCEGQTRTLTSIPAATIPGPSGSGNPGTFTGTGVSGTVFTAPTPSGNSQSYPITYTFGYCSVTQNITVWHAPSAAVCGANQVICNSVATLTATAPAFGTGTWSVLSGPGTIASPTSANTSISGLLQGQTTLVEWRVTNGPCQYNADTMSISYSYPPTTSAAGNDTSVCDSTVVLHGNTPTIGTGTWTVQSGSGTFANANSPTTTVTGLSPGANVFRWSISNGTCLASNDNVTITYNLPITATSSAIDITCNGDNDGQAIVTPSGGTGVYSYAWTPSGPNNDTIGGLSSGFYSVVVTDANSCTASTTVYVSEPATLQAGASVTDALCNGGNGGVNLTVQGGTSGYSFNWSNSATTEDLSGVSSGTYSVTVTDSHGCTTTASAFVAEPPAMSVSPVVIPISCNGLQDGSINLNVLGGAGGYQYDWSTGDTTATLSGLGAATYSVVVTDANGCTQTASMQVTEPTAINLSANVGHETSGNDGSIDLMISGGTPMYTYSWSNGSHAENLYNITAGTYTVTVTDINGCTATLSVQVNGVGLPGELDESDISLYPNPSTGKFNLSITNPLNGKVWISIFDISGREVTRIQALKQGNGFLQPIDITGSPDGVYLVRIALEGGGQITRRVVKY